MGTSVIRLCCDGRFPVFHFRPLPLSASLSEHSIFSKDSQWRSYAGLTHFEIPQVQRVYTGSNITRSHCAATGGGISEPSSPWDDKPYDILPTGKIVYLDEEDVVSFLDPPKHLIPLDPSSYNPAAYLWKKIEDIPEERRHRLLYLLNPRLISRVWGVAGTRYENSKLSTKSASTLLSDGNSSLATEYWYCKKSGGPIPIAWINFFEKAIFGCKDGKKYGRLIGKTLLGQLVSSVGPSYFMISQKKEVMSTEEPCDVAYEFGDGLFDLPHYPRGFPKPGKHPWPLDDEVVIYVRHVGPGVAVGEAWQEGKKLEAVPRKLCGNILMVKDFFPSHRNEK